MQSIIFNKKLIPLKTTWLLYFILISLSIASCKKESSEPDNLQTSTIEVVVKNKAGGVESNMTVYLFDTPATEENGKTISKALKKGVTDEKGVARLNVKDLTDFQNGNSLYVTALEPMLNKENNVLGSVIINKTNTQDISVQLDILEKKLKYSFGFMSTTITSEIAIAEYERWKITQVVACGSGLRVVADVKSQTLVEAMGFGTLLAAYAKDKNTFDGLMTFYKSKRTPESKNMMGWKVTCDGIIDPGSATDGDLDVAFALIVAHKQWGEQQYLDDAKNILQIIKDNLILNCVVDGNNVSIVGPGYSGIAWGGCDMMNIMYHSPAFFKVFAEVTGDAAWAKLADDTYTLLAKGVNNTTGLVPDWQTATGTPGPGGRVGHYGYDACRAPWRLSLDYLWNGNQQSKNWAVKISDWANGVGPKNIVDGYELNGTPIGKNGLNSAFLGGFAVATMTNNQGMVDSFSTELSKLNDTYWFNLNTRVLYLFTLTGNFWEPEYQ